MDPGREGRGLENGEVVSPPYPTLRREPSQRGPEQTKLARYRKFLSIYENRKHLPFTIRDASEIKNYHEETLSLIEVTM